MNYKWLKVEQHASGVVKVQMNKPPVNALGKELVQELTAVAESLKTSKDARVVLLTSGLAHFCAGADLKERRTMTPEEAKAFVPKLAGCCEAFAALPMPTIAAVQGVAAGGGMELALACDLRVLSEDATIGLRETALAIIPGAGGTQRLPRMLGIARAKRWIFTAKLFDAKEAKQDGVADLVVAKAELDAEARALAETIAANGPLALRLAKQAIEQGADRPLAEALEVEWACYQKTLETEDRVEALEAFAEKRPPRFKGS